MKKTYIVPEASVYAVNTKDSLLISLSNNDADPTLGGDVKEEKSEAGSGIWDLYN